MPDFFDTVDSMGLVESHIQKILALEDRKAALLIARYREIRHELQDRLLGSRPGSFTRQQLRAVMVQVDTAIEAITNGLSRGMVDAGDLVARAGVDHLETEFKAFEKEFRGAGVPINVNAAAVASDVNELLVSKYEGSIKKYGAGLSEEISQALSAAVIEELPYSEVVHNLGSFLLQDEWKIRRLARTELHGVYAKGKLMTMEQLQDGPVPDLMKTLIQPMDTRTAADSKYAERINIERGDLIVPLDKPFRYTWAGKKRVYDHPPDRPNDRSILVPYRPSWG